MADQRSELDARAHALAPDFAIDREIGRGGHEVHGKRRRVRRAPNCVVKMTALALLMLEKMVNYPSGDTPFSSR